MNQPGGNVGGTTTQDDATTGELVSRLSQEVSSLVRGEMELARAELGVKAKHAGIGAGLFGAGGLVAFYGLAVLIAAAVLGLALAMEAWLAAVLVGLTLLAVAGVVALVARRQVGAAAPALPEKAVEGVREDVRAVRRGAGR